MRWLKGSVVMLLLALWVPASMHCALEPWLPERPWLQCCCADAGDPQSPANCDQQPCGSLETGFCKTDEQGASLVPPLMAAQRTPAAAAECLPCTGLHPSPTREPPLERSRPWQFARRAARPPRAPSRVS